MSTYFTSDEHHGHANIVAYCNRPFRDVDHMTREFIARHNATVKPTDMVIHVGDFSLQEKFVPEVLRQLQGEHALVPGNHDKCHPKYRKGLEAAKARYLGYGFKWVEPTWELGPFLVAHMPYVQDDGHGEKYAQYRPVDKGRWLLHGHIHEKWTVNARQINVGVDAWDFTPVPYEWLLAMTNR